MANVKGKNIIIDEKQGKLLLSSKIINDYMWLKEILLKNEKITKNDIGNLSFEKQSFLNSTLYDDLYRQACSELEYRNHEFSDSTDKSKWKRCFLCGEPTKYVNYFINKNTNQVINMGNDCRDNYNVIDPKDKEKAKQIEREGLLLTKRNMLNNKLPGIVGRIDELNVFVESIKTFVNSKYITEFNDSLKLVKTYYEKWIKPQRPTNNILNNLENAVIDCEKIKERILKHIDTLKKDEFYINNTIYNWVKQKGDMTLISFLREDEKITLRSAFRIFEPGLMNKIIDKTALLLVNKNYKFSNIDPSNKQLTIQIKSNIELVINYEDFIEDYGDEIFNNSKIDLTDEYVVNNGKILSKKSLSIAITKMKPYINITDYKIIKFDEEENLITFKNNKTDSIFTINMAKFIDKFKKILYNNSEFDENELINYILTKFIDKYSIAEYNEWQEELKDLRNEHRFHKKN